MDEALVWAFKRKDHAYILERLQPLFLKYLQGIPRQQQKDFLQEYYLVCIRTIEAYPFPQT